MYAECYHYRTVYYTAKNEEGEEVEKKTRKGCHSYRNWIFWLLFSEIYSGLLHLNCDKAQIKIKCYNKLELKEEMNFDNSISALDYEWEKRWI